MKIQTLFSLTAMTVMVSVLAAQPAMAGTGSYGSGTTNPGNPYGQYGSATPAQSIIVDKKVGYGSTTKGGVPQYVDNFSPSDARFAPGQKVYFQVKVKNTSNVKLTNVQVKDIVPAYVMPVEGPGTFDANSRTISYTIAELNPGQEDVKYFLMQVIAQEQLPADKGLMCLTNRAEAQAGAMNDNDTAQFCIEKVVTGVQKVPATGPAFGLALVGLQFAGVGAGLYLRKKTS